MTGTITQPDPSGELEPQEYPGPVVKEARLMGGQLDAVSKSEVPHWKGRAQSKACSCCCSVVQLYPALSSPMDCSTPGFPFLHYLLGFSQICVC